MSEGSSTEDILAGRSFRAGGPVYRDRPYVRFKAQWPGRCKICSERWSEGETLRHDDDGNVIHNRCYPRKPKPKGATEQVCTTCFMTSCDCETP